MLTFNLVKGVTPIVCHFNPWKQAYLQKLYDYLSAHETPVRKLIVFGSSVTLAATPNSDIDVAVLCDCKNKQEFYALENTICDNCSSNMDIIDYNSLREDSRLKYEIDTKGVTLWERAK